MPRFVKPSVQLLPYNLPYPIMLELVELMARQSTQTALNREGTIDFVKRRIAAGEYNVLRHGNISVLITCSRGVSHELVRHHVGLTYTQESTRWCNYDSPRFKGELTFISGTEDHIDTLHLIEEAYLHCLQGGGSVDQARALLPNALKTSVGATGNIEAWRNLIIVRSHPKVHPEFRSIVTDLRNILVEHYPAFFEDLPRE